MANNTKTLKKFITELTNKYNFNVESAQVGDSRTNIIIIFTQKIKLYLSVVIKETVNKYEYTAVLKNAQIKNTITYTGVASNINEIEQLVFILETYINNNFNTIECKACVKTSHWGIKLVTVETTHAIGKVPKGLRANLYVSWVLEELINDKVIKIDGLTLSGTSEKDPKPRAKYNRGIIDFVKATKEHKLDEYAIQLGFPPLSSYCSDCREAYVHPSCSWFRGRLY